MNDNATVRLLLGDCLEIMKDIPDNSVDMILCDLPYGTTKNQWDTVIPLDILWREYLRVCRGAILLFAQTPFDKVLGASNLSMLKYEWIWEKTHTTGFLNAKKMPLKAHENILVFYKKLPTYNPIKSTGHPRKTAIKRKDSGTCYGKQDFEEIAYDSTERYPRSVLKYSSDKQKSKLHPTQKPVALLEYLIKTYTKEGDVILDNCMGSGSTGVACINTGRSFVGIEKDTTYYSTAVKRLKERTHATNDN